MRQAGLAAMSAHLPLKGGISCVTAHRQGVCERASMSYAPRRHSVSIAAHLFAFMARSSRDPIGQVNGGRMPFSLCLRWGGEPMLEP
jgi:hypothetical protein